MTARISRASWIGLATVGIVVAVVVVGFLRPTLGGGGQTVDVAFANVAPIARFDREVRVAGVDVGTIGSVRRAGGLAIVTLTFPSGRIGPIHADATAALRPHTIFDGTAYVDFSPGSPSAPLLGRRTLGVAQTSVYVSLDMALRVADPRTRGALRSALSDLDRSLQPREALSLRRTFAGQPRLFTKLAPAMRALEGPSRDELKRAVHGFADTAAGLAGAREQFGPLLASTARTIAAIRVQAARPLDQTLVALAPALASAARGGAVLRAIVDHLQPLASRLVPAMVALRPTLVALRPVLVDARPVLSPAASFLAQLRVAVGEAGDAAAPTRADLRALSPTLATLHRGLIPFLRSRGRNGLPIYETLAAVPASAGASMSGVRSAATASAKSAAPGHGWHFYTAVLGASSGHPTCATIAAPIRAIVAQLGQCIQ